MKMRFSVLFGGKAGQGVNELAKLFSEIAGKNGYYVFNYRDYGSLIRGGNSFNIVSLSDKKIMSHEDKYDVVVALDEESVEIHKNLKKNGLVMDEKIGINEILEKNKLDKKVTNIIFLGFLMKTLGFNLEDLLNELKKEFKGRKLLEQDLIAAKKGYEKAEDKRILFKVKKIERNVFDGSDGIVYGAINSGLDLYIAYPMTPSTPVLHKLAEKQEKHMIFQPESELAVVNMALGASFAGARVMVGTSGGGFDLMSEGLSMQGISEIPLVVYLASRPGPGTGVPTHTMQSDLKDALNAGHGEFPRIVIAPGDPEECVRAVNDAFYLSQKYRVLVIILSDKHVAESLFTAELPKVNEIKIDYGKTDKNYSEKRCLPGLNICKASGYTHNEYGITTEDGKINVWMLDRLKKKKLEIEKEKLEKIKMYGKGEDLVIGFGSVKGAILDALDEVDCRFLQVLYLEPLDKKKIQEEIKKSKKVYVVENNSTGQLADIIEGLGFKVERILKYDARPFTKEEVKNAIR